MGSCFYTGELVLFAFLKLFTPFNQVICTTLTIIPTFQEGDGYLITSWILIFLSVHVTDAIINSYYLSTLCLWRMHQMSNDRLANLVRKIQEHGDLHDPVKQRRFLMQGLCDASDLIDDIAETNSQIYLFWIRLQQMFPFQITAVFVYYLLNNIIELFFFYHFLWNLTYVNGVYVFATAWKMFYQGLDMFLLANSSYLVNKISDETRNILHSQLDGAIVLDDRLTKKVSASALICSKLTNGQIVNFGPAKKD